MIPYENLCQMLKLWKTHADSHSGTTSFSSVNQAQKNAYNPDFVVGQINDESSDELQLSEEE